MGKKGAMQKNIRVGDSGSVNQGLSDAIQRLEFSSGQVKEDQVRWYGICCNFVIMSFFLSPLTLFSYVPCFGQCLKTIFILWSQKSVSFLSLLRSSTNSTVKKYATTTSSSSFETMTARGGVTHSLPFTEFQYLCLTKRILNYLE